MAKIQNNQDKIKQAYISYLETIGFDYFLTGSTRYELTLKSARRLAERYFEAIKTEGAILFWVGEKFEVKDGYHIHGLLKIPNKYGKADPDNVFLFQRLIDHWQLATGNKAISNHDGVIEWNKESWNALNLSRFKKSKGAGGYCSKYVFKSNADYDLLC